MSDIQRVIDGDTLQSNNDTLRVGFINTPESVHPDGKRNTPEGKVASSFAKAVLPEDTEITTNSYGNDHFGRNVSGVNRVIDGVEVDYGLVALDQQMSTYYTEFGEHPDPLKHDQYKEYYSKHVPYQFGTAEESLTTEQFNEMTVKHEQFTKVYSDFKDGKATQEQLDKATVNLYGDATRVMQYRHQLSAWNRPIEMEQQDSIRGAMRLAMEEDPELREQYNAAVRNGHLMESPIPEKEPSFWKKASTSFSMLGSVSNSMDTERLWDTRRLGDNTGIPEGELVKGLPEQYHAVILSEANKHNDNSALLLRDQLIDDIENNRVFDNMEWYAQLGYGALAVIADPLALTVAAPVAKAGQAVNYGVRAWTQSRLIRNSALMASWAAGGAVEGAVFNAPRLSGDHTYTARDYQLDILMDAGFGLGLGGIVEYAAKPLLGKYTSEIRKSRVVEQKQIQEHVEAQGKPEEAKTPELQEVKVKVEAVQAEAKTKQRVADLTNREFTPWEAISEVSADGFGLASSTLQNVFKKNTSMRKLINSQLGLNKKSLTPEERVIANKLNSDILHIASAFPEGKVPAGVSKAIEAVTFKQKTFKRNNALQDVLTGNTTNQTSTLAGYLKSLRNHKEMWEGYDVQPMSSDEFFLHQSEWLSRENLATDEELFNLTQELPKEISYLKDVIELNRMANKSADLELKQLVEELNGMVATRLEQKEFGDVKQYSDTTKSFGKTVPMTAPEIAAQLKKEGLIPRTSEYSTRMKELRTTGRVVVDTEVNTLGNIRQQSVGSVAKNSMEESDFGGQDTIDLFKEDFEQDLLPRSFTETETQSAYKDVNVESLKTLRERLRSDVGNKLGVFTIKGKKEYANQKERLGKVMSAIKSKRAETLARMVKAGKWQNVEDVIRVSHTIAEEQKLKASAVKPSSQTKTVEPSTDKPEAEEVYKPVTEEELEVLTFDNTIPQAVKDDIQARAGKAYDKMVEESAERVSNKLTDFVRTGEKATFAAARKPVGTLDYAGRLAGKITEDLGSKFQNSELTSLEFTGSRVTEIGRGYGGAVRRKATGGIIRDAVYKEAMMQVAPSYVKAMDSYALAQGKGAVGRMNAQQSAGGDSKLVNQFNRDVFLVQEYRRQGKEIPTGIRQSVKDFITDWDKFMDYNHNKLVEANVGGFTKERKVKHYVPHVWEYGKLLSAISKHGEQKIEELFTRAYQSSKNNGVNPVDKVEAKELAKRQIKWIKEQADETIAEDQFLPVKDTRAKKRLDLDTTMEFEGISIMDLLDTEVISLGTKYANRVAGWVGLSKSTDGMLVSQLDIDTLKQNMVQEGKTKGIKTDTYEKYYDDLINMMFGRPVRGGLTQELRQLKDLTALTRMGGLGTAQLIETGQVVTRSVLNTFSSEPVVRKVMSMANKNVDDIELMQEIQSISNLTDDIEWLDRQSVHLDQHELAKVGKARQMSLWLADTATLGSLKAPASRLLGKTTGYNAIRRFQSRIAQASFVLDVSKHFKNGTGKMGNARMADVGLTEVDGTNVELSDVFNNLVEYGSDGLPTKLNVDKWPKHVREQFQYAMIRDEAQQIQRTHVGELPPWMNSPMMALVMQFRQMPIVANNKQLGRSLAFADKEAVTAVMLNAAMSGLVRYSKFAALGLGVAAITGNEWEEPNEGHMQVDKYIAQFGIFPDARDLVYSAYETGTTQDADRIMGQVPVLGLMKDYYEAFGGSENAKEQIDAAQGLTPLGNTAYGDMIYTWIQETFGD